MYNFTFLTEQNLKSINVSCIAFRGMLYLVLLPGKAYYYVAPTEANAPETNILFCCSRTVT